MPIVPPVLNLDDATFWDGVAEGELRAQACTDCGNVRFPMNPMCPQCGSLAWTDHRLSGRGTLFSWIRSGDPSDPASPSRIVACIALDEGFMLISNLTDADDARLRPDAPVEVRFETFEDEIVLPQFRLVDHGVN